MTLKTKLTILGIGLVVAYILCMIFVTTIKAMFYAAISAFYLLIGLTIFGYVCYLFIKKPWKRKRN